MIVTGRNPVKTHSMKWLPKTLLNQVQKERVAMKRIVIGTVAMIAAVAIV
jgi:hypothetical protein